MDPVVRLLTVLTMFNEELPAWLMHAVPEQVWLLLQAWEIPWSLPQESNQWTEPPWHLWELWLMQFWLTVTGQVV